MSMMEGVCELSRKRTHSGPDGLCIGGCGNASCSQKRSTEEPAESVRWWYLKLESESEPFDSDEPDSLKNESLWSIQLRDTDTVHDSDDSESRWRNDHADEYEVASLHSSENEIRPFSCSSDDESCSSVEGLVIATVAPDGITIDYFADSSSDLSSSDESSDPELQPQDKWACLRCKQKNQPIPRYCQHCFAVRKKWFPPRPAARKKRALHHTLTIPPQIQITPNLSIPDLSEMKGNPIADQVRRTYDEAIAKYASLSGEEQLAQLRERVRRHRLLRSHSDSQMAKLFNLAGPLSQDDSRVKSAILTKAKEHVITALSSKVPLYSEESSQDSSEAQPVADQPKQQTDPAVADDLEKVETQSRVSDASADTIPKELANYKWPQRSKNTSDELDFREKVEAYLQQCNLPDTPPSSQPIETPGLDEDCVDGPRRPQEDCVDAPPKPTVAEDPPPTPSASSFSSVIQGCGKMCTFCEVNEANTAFIHNGKGHLCACYQCAKKVYAAKGQCPICQRQASNICKIYS